MTVRSRRFFGPTAVTSSTAVLLYTVPAARTARFSLITVACSVGAGGNYALRVNASTGANIRFTATAAGVTEECLQGLILNPSDELWCVIPASHTVNFSGFGSLLDGAPS